MKKFVKGLLVCGFAASLLAACGTKKGCSSSECPKCPDPEPAPVKEEWSDYELFTFAELDIGDVPFGYELEIVESGYGYGMVYAVSKNVVTDEDVDAFAEEFSTGYFSIAESYDEATYDIGKLDVFDPDSSFYEFGAASEFADCYDMFAFGRDEDGYLTLLVAQSYIPAYGAEDAWYVAIAHDEEAPEVVHDNIGFVKDAFNDELRFAYNAPSILSLYDNLATPAVVEDVTGIWLTNFPAAFPFSYGNANNLEYYAPAIQMTYAKGFNDAGYALGYSPSEYVSLVYDARDVDGCIGFNIDPLTYDATAIYSGLNGFDLEVVYSIEPDVTETAYFISIMVMPMGFSTVERSYAIVDGLFEYLDGDFDWRDEESFQYNEDDFGQMTVFANLQYEYASGMEDAAVEYITDYFVNCGVISPLYAELGVIWNTETEGNYTFQVAFGKDQAMVHVMGAVEFNAEAGTFVISVQAQEVLLDYVEAFSYASLNAILLKEYSVGLIGDAILNALAGSIELACQSPNIEAAAAGVSYIAQVLENILASAGTVNESDYDPSDWDPAEGEGILDAKQAFDASVDAIMNHEPVYNAESGEFDVSGYDDLFNAYIAKYLALNSAIAGKKYDVKVPAMLDSYAANFNTEHPGYESQVADIVDSAKTQISNNCDSWDSAKNVYDNACADIEALLPVDPE